MLITISNYNLLTIWLTLTTITTILEIIISSIITIIIIILTIIIYNLEVIWIKIIIRHLILVVHEIISFKTTISNQITKIIFSKIQILIVTTHFSQISIKITKIIMFLWIIRATGTINNNSSH